MEKSLNDLPIRAKEDEYPVGLDAAKSTTPKEEVTPRLNYLQDEESSEQVIPDEELLDIAWRYKWLALLCVCAFPLGQNCEWWLSAPVNRMN
jgi:hypothetical protein